MYIESVILRCRLVANNAYGHSYLFENVSQCGRKFINISASYFFSLLVATLNLRLI